MLKITRDGLLRLVDPSKWRSLGPAEQLAQVILPPGTGVRGKVRALPKADRQRLEAIAKELKEALRTLAQAERKLAEKAARKKFHEDKRKWHRSASEEEIGRSLAALSRVYTDDYIAGLSMAVDSARGALVGRPVYAEACRLLTPPKDR